MDPDDCLNILESQPAFLGLYTQICLCYSVPDDSAYPKIIKILTNGLERLSSSFPWVAGQVVDEAGIFKIKPLEKIPRMIVKDLRNDPSMPAMELLRRARFPSSMFDENIIAPRNTLAGTSAEVTSDFPVFCLQANFITGGLLLTFNTSHASNDFVGQGLIMNLLSKACQGEEFTDEEISAGNMTRRNLIPLPDKPSTPGPTLDFQLVKSSAETAPEDSKAKPAPEPEPGPGPGPQYTWAYFIFSPASLADVKSLATKSLTSGFVSTDDALTAFIYQSITRIRLPRLNPKADVTFTRAIDIRRHLGIPATYLGLAQNLTYHNYPIQQLVEASLGSIASDLRKAVDPKTSTLKQDTLALAAILNSAEDKNVVNFTATIDLSKDIMLSSWSKVDCYELHFNLGLGKPEAVRRPQICLPVESLIYLMPKALDGEIAVLLCLRNEDLNRLRKDVEFAKYGEYVG